MRLPTFFTILSLPINIIVKAMLLHINTMVAGIFIIPWNSFVYIIPCRDWSLSITYWGWCNCSCRFGFAAWFDVYGSGCTPAWIHHWMERVVFIIFINKQVDWHLINVRVSALRSLGLRPSYSGTLKTQRQSL